MKLIYRHSSNQLSIWSDNLCYKLQIKNRLDLADKHAENHYFPNLEFCFEEMLDYLQKKNLGTNEQKDLENIIKIIRDTRTEFLDEIRPVLKGRFLGGKSTGEPPKA